MNLLGKVHLISGLETFLGYRKRNSLLALAILNVGGAIGFVNYFVRKIVLNERNEIICFNGCCDYCAQDDENGSGENVPSVPCKST